jgi:hypothetical protein
VAPTQYAASTCRPTARLPRAVRLSLDTRPHLRGHKTEGQMLNTRYGLLHFRLHLDFSNILKNGSIPINQGAGFVNFPSRLNFMSIYSSLCRISGELARLGRGYKGTNSTRLHGPTNLSFVNDIVNPEGNARLSSRRTVPPFPRSFYFQRRYAME